MSNNPDKRIIIIGLDGVPYKLIDNFAKNNIMPNIKSIINKGLFTEMQSSIPEISSVAWSSIITGKNPGEHGIFGFTDFPENTYSLSFPNFSSLRVPPFWIINVPSTFPASELNGILVSGFVALDMERSVYPSSFMKKLKEINYVIDVDASKAHQSMDLFLNNLDKVLEARIKLLYNLWDNEKWDNFMFVFTGTDRLFHFLWEAFEDKKHKYHQELKKHFKKIDEAIGKIVSEIKENDLLILLSDHGFELLLRNININYILQEEGFLKLKKGGQGNYNDIDYGTKAFALDPARLYINLIDKYPCGSVTRQDYSEIVNDLKQLFMNFNFNGEKAISKIYTKNEIYKGPFLERAPDIVLVGHSGINLKGKINAAYIEEDEIFTGKHTQHDAFFLTNKNLKKWVPEGFNVSDVMSIIKRYKGGQIDA